MFAVVITGPPGSGKSCVLTALHDALGDAGIGNAAVEADDLARAYPPVGHRQVMHHVEALSASYAAAGHDLLLIAATLEDDRDARALVAAAGADERLLVRLEAPPATLERRLTEREPATWSGLPALVASARRLAETMPSLPGVDLVLSTEHDPAEAIAARVAEVLELRHPFVHLVLAELPLLDAAVAGDDALARALGVPVVAGWSGFPDAVARLRDSLAADPGASWWWSRLYVVADELVGWGGFKGPPVDGVVEVGYAIAPERQGRGLATAALRALLREAYSSQEVQAVIAETLPERNASVRVLEKAGFVHVGSAEARGRAVWRFRHERPAPTPPAAPR